MEQRAGDRRTIIMIIIIIIIIYRLRVQFSPMWGSLRLAPINIPKTSGITIMAIGFSFLNSYLSCTVHSSDGGCPTASKGTS